MADVLICSHVEDLHTDAVLWGLDVLGCSALHWRANCFPADQALTIAFEADGHGRHSIASDGHAIDLDHVATVWNRRPGGPRLSPAMDSRDKEFAHGESWQHLGGFLDTVCLDAFWVNPPAVSRRDVNKPHQIRLAKAAGLTVPATLFSNSPDEIVQFFDRHDGDVIFKTYGAKGWLEGDRNASIFMNYTSTVTREDLRNRRALSFCPGIFQAKIEKAFEVRTTVMGKSFFSVRIDPAESDQGRLDWRLERHNLRLSPMELPADVRSKCQLFMESSGMVFGCFDFIVSPAMEYYFLEVNQMGQFLWKEDILSELPMLDSMCAFLMSARSDFVYEPGNTRLRYAAYTNSERYENYLKQVKDDSLPQKGELAEFECENGVL